MNVENANTRDLISTFINKFCYSLEKYTITTLLALVSYFGKVDYNFSINFTAINNTK